MAYNYHFKSIYDLLKVFSNEQICTSYLEKLRWNGNVESPFMPDSKVYKLANNRYKCSKTNKYFNVKTNTIFEGTKLPLQKWFLAIYLLSSNKKGISSYQLANELSITQKTAWFVLQRIRHATLDNIFELAGDNIQVDETFVGGKNKNRHWDKKVEQSQGRSYKDKTPVLGILEAKEVEINERPHKVIANKTVKEKTIVKDSKVLCFTIPNTQREVIQPLILDNVKLGSTITSDEWRAYRGLDKYYTHNITDHSIRQYVNANGDTSNAVENVWTHFKRMWASTYSGRITPKHLQKYVSEYSFRFNTKTKDNSERFNILLSDSWGKRLTYKKLIAA